MSRPPSAFGLGKRVAGHGPRTPTPPRSGLTSALPLIEACGPRGSLKAARRALSPAALAERDDNGATALMVAARHGRADIVDMLLRWTFPDLIDNEGQTALMHAAKAPTWTEGAKRCLERLIVVDDPTRIDTQGRTALDHAAIAGNIDSIRFLWSLLHDQSDPLRWAVAHECVAAVQFLAPICALDGSLDHEGPTALAAAAETGNIQTLTALMAACGSDRLARQAPEAFDAARKGWSLASHGNDFTQMTAQTLMQDWSELFRHRLRPFKIRVMFTPVFAALASFVEEKAIEGLIGQCSVFEAKGKPCPELKACMEAALIQRAMVGVVPPTALDSSLPFEKRASPTRPRL